MHLASFLEEKQRHLWCCVSLLARMCAVLENTFETFDDTDFEDRIHRAVSESIEKQSYLPLVKQELQCKIQYERLSRGEPELILEEEQPKVYKLTDEEKRKKDVRLMQNRRSAFRSRIRLKEKEEYLKKTVDSLYNEQRQLTREFRQLKEEKRLTLAKLQAHLSVCRNTAKKEKLKYELLLH